MLLNLGLLLLCASHAQRPFNSQLDPHGQGGDRPAPSREHRPARSGRPDWAPRQRHVEDDREHHREQRERDYDQLHENRARRAQQEDRRAPRTVAALHPPEKDESHRAAQRDNRHAPATQRNNRHAPNERDREEEHDGGSGNGGGQNHKDEEKFVHKYKHDHKYAKTHPKKKRRYKYQDNFLHQGKQYFMPEPKTYQETEETGAEEHPEDAAANHDEVYNVHAHNGESEQHSDSTAAEANTEDETAALATVRNLEEIYRTPQKYGAAIYEVDSTQEKYENGYTESSLNVKNTHTLKTYADNDYIDYNRDLHDQPYAHSP